ncbi:hypothetical protein NKH77_56105 [Streptomyces sp. M19]
MSDELEAKVDQAVAAYIAALGGCTRCGRSSSGCGPRPVSCWR